MSVIDVGSRWRNRDRTFERAIGRHLAVAGAFVLLIVVSFIEERVTRDNPIAALGTVGAWVVGLVMLWRWFGGGKILLGLWLWLLSSGLVISLIVIAEVAREVLGRIGSPSDRLAGALFAVVLGGVFFGSWALLKRAEARL